MELKVFSLKVKGEYGTNEYAAAGLNLCYKDGFLKPSDGINHVIAAIQNNIFVSMELYYYLPAIQNDGSFGRRRFTHKIYCGEKKAKKIDHISLWEDYIYDLEGNELEKIGLTTESKNAPISVFKTPEEFLKIHLNLLEASKQNIFYYNIEQQGLEQGPKK